ncbi:uncharacterized protein LOC136033820 isoform X1 [Artemia franciscana]|uniref:uncharacterized protein LOC136033820 isoform X1 n=1 Tax=Artemia franciscana TaxID=6661 RepID=UPI0032DADECE
MWRDDERCGSDKRDEKIIYFYLIDDPTVIAQCNPAGSAPCCSSYGWCGLGTPWCGCDSCIDYRGTTEESKTEITSSPGDESSASAIPTEETTITSTQEPTSGFTTDVPPEPSCNEVTCELWFLPIVIVVPIASLIIIAVIVYFSCFKKAKTSSTLMNNQSESSSPRLIPLTVLVTLYNPLLLEPGIMPFVFSSTSY